MTPVGERDQLGLDTLHGTHEAFEGVVHPRCVVGPGKGDDFLAGLERSRRSQGAELTLEPVCHLGRSGEVAGFDRCPKRIELLGVSVEEDRGDLRLRSWRSGQRRKGPCRTRSFRPETRRS